MDWGRMNGLATLAEKQRDKAEKEKRDKEKAKKDQEWNDFIASRGWNEPEPRPSPKPVEKPAQKGPNFGNMEPAQGQYQASKNNVAKMLHDTASTRNELADNYYVSGTNMSMSQLKMKCQQLGLDLRDMLYIDSNDREKVLASDTPREDLKMYADNKRVMRQ